MWHFRAFPCPNPGSLPELFVCSSPSNFHLPVPSSLERHSPQNTDRCICFHHPFDLEKECRSVKRLELPVASQFSFVSRDSLLAMKRLAGRLKDLADIAALEEIREISDKG
jgi:hypothetical protein